MDTSAKKYHCQNLHQRKAEQDVATALLVQIERQKLSATAVQQCDINVRRELPVTVTETTNFGQSYVFPELIL